MREHISACITAGNEEKNIRRCLKSVSWADEIIVVDSFSEDKTVEIAREYTDKIHQHEWLGYIGQKNLIKEMAEGPWILFIDADEEISDELRQQVLAEFENGASEQYNGYEFSRMVWYLGKWIKHGEWYPDVKLRLFRKSKGVCGGREPHDRTTVDGPVKRLSGRMHHYTYDSIADQVDTVNRFSSITAKGWYDDRRPFRWFDLLFRPPCRFLRGYFLKLGLLDGFAGLVIAATAAYGVFVKYSKLREFYLQEKKAVGGRL